MGKIRCCVVLGAHWAARMGGAQFQVKCLLELITKRPDFETFYVTHLAPKELQQNGYQIVPFGFGQMSSAGATLLQLPSLYRVLKSLKPTVVYQRCLMPYTAVCALYCMRYGAQFVFHIASDNDVMRSPIKGWTAGAFLRRILRRISEYGMRRADAIVAQTRDQARMLSAEFGLTAALVVPNFHPIPAETAMRRDPSRLRIVWVANFKPVKNPEMFVELAEAFSNEPAISFIMIGRPGEPSQYGSLHARIKRMRNLEILGELPLERVDQEIASSDILVNTSSAEGFSNTFIQAWLRGVPVVSLNVDPDGCLSCGGAGVVTGSLRQMISVIADFSRNRDRLRKLGEDARAYAQAHHQLEHAQELVELLSKTNTTGN
jgi:glycosyltransferase involved in cell wall biosynthesis